jgi:hypothetical protein
MNEQGLLYPAFEWIGSLAMSRAIGESLWIYPVVQAFHLVFLAILIGALLIVDLRLLGRGMIRQSTSQVARDAWPWLLTALAGMLLTGLPQLMQNWSRQYYSEFFWQKMYFLAAALVFTFTVRRWVAAADTRVAPVWGKVVAAVSIFLWMNVAIAGRLIGLLS